MTKPIILVTSDIKAIDGYNWHAAPSTYLAALTSTAKVIPLIAPSLGADMDDAECILNQVDGVLATGSRSNVNPALYGLEPTEANGPYDPERDGATLPLLRRAVQKGIPVFAICRGMQELNVAFGGSLITEIQNMDGREDHRAPVSEHQDERFRLAHSITIKTGSLLETVLGTDKIEVNSLHRQALGTLGDGIEVIAEAEDGTIEAVGVKNACGYVIATQWHPEYWVNSDLPSRRLFEAFGNAARNYKTQKNG